MAKASIAGGYLGSYKLYWLPGRQTSLSVDREHPNDSREPRTAEGGEETSTDFGDNWFDYCFEQTPERVELQLSETGKDGTTLARFNLGKQLLACQLGELTLARFPLCVARLDNIRQVPDEESAYDRMFLQLLNQKFDGIYLESISPESSLWRYLQTSLLVRRSFSCYSKLGPSPHLLIRLNGTFSDYLIISSDYQQKRGRIDSGKSGYCESSETCN